MTFIQHYDSPLGAILLAADDVGLTGLWFEGQKYFAATLPTEVQTKETPALREGRRGWTCTLREKSRKPLRPPSPRHSVSPFRMEDPLRDPLRKNDDLRRYCAKTCPRARSSPPIRPRRRKRRRKKSHLPHHPLPPRHRQERPASPGYAGGLHRKAYLLAMERRQGDRETLDFRL